MYLIYDSNGTRVTDAHFLVRKSSDIADNLNLRPEEAWEVDLDVLFAEQTYNEKPHKELVEDLVLRDGLVAVNREDFDTAAMARARRARWERLEVQNKEVHKKQKEEYELRKRGIAKKLSWWQRIFR